MILDDATLASRAEAIRWILLDVDGVLTDGLLRYAAGGDELVSFHIQDGLALELAREAGLGVGLLSGRDNPAVARRARELDLDTVMLGEDDKGLTFRDFLDEHDLDASEIAYMGDDLTDLPMLARCGLGFAPADAAPEVRERAHHVVERRGGRGAAREMIELLLRARGDWDGLVARFEE